MDDKELYELRKKLNKAEQLDYSIKKLDRIKYDSLHLDADSLCISEEMYEELIVQPVKQAIRTIRESFTKELEAL